MRRKMGKFAGLPVMMVGAALLFATQANAAQILIDKIDAGPGSPAAFNVVLATSQGESVAGTQNDITFDPTIVSATAASVCRINSAISDATAPACQDDPSPAGCECARDPQVGPCKQLNRALDDVEGGMKRFRGLILALGNTNPINDPTKNDMVTLYTCTFQVATGATEGAVVPLACSNEGASDPDGKACGAEGAGCATTTCSSGSIKVQAPVPPTPTATATTAVVNTPTNTRATEPTTPPTAVSTPTRVRTTGGGSSDDDGCQVVTPASGHLGWLLFAPAALLLWSRRRSR